MRSLSSERSQPFDNANDLLAMMHVTSDAESLHAFKSPLLDELTTEGQRDGLRDRQTSRMCRCASEASLMRPTLNSANALASASRKALDETSDSSHSSRLQKTSFSAQNKQCCFGHACFSSWSKPTLRHNEARIAVSVGF